MDDMTIETARLSLRRWRENDADDLYRYASDSRVSGPALWPRHESVEMSLDVIRRYFMPADHLLAMTLRDTGEVVGCIGLVPAGEEHHDVGSGMREVGYWIGYPHWGKGLTTEALRAFIGYCGSVAGIDSLLLTTGCGNTRSQRVAVKCGFEEVARYEHDGVESLAYHLRIK